MTPSYAVLSGAIIIISTDFIPENTAYGFDDLMLELINKGENVSVKPFNGYWLDIGRPDDYEKASNDIEKII